MPYFSAAGYDCFALSLRCQGGSDRPAGGGPWAGARQRRLAPAVR
jgi:alpha-beta hydrolase superfamily lysophospholipase